MSYWANGLPVAQGSFRFGAGKPKPELALKPAAGGFASARRGRGLAAFDTLTLAGRLRAAAFGFGFGSGLIACRRGRTVCSSCAAPPALCWRRARPPSAPRGLRQWAVRSRPRRALARWQPWPVSARLRARQFRVRLRARQFRVRLRQQLRACWSLVPSGAARRRRRRQPGPHSLVRRPVRPRHRLAQEQRQAPASWRVPDLRSSATWARLRIPTARSWARAVVQHPALSARRPLR